MKVCCVFLLASLACTTHAGSVFSGPDIGHFALEPNDIGERPKKNFDHNTNAMRLTFMTSTVQPKSVRTCAGVQLILGWILTAAECFDNPEHIFVRLTAPGHYDYNDKHFEMEKDQLRPRNRLPFKLHPDYNATTKANNIALIKTSRLFQPDKESALVLPYVRDRNRTYEKGIAFVSTYTSDKQIREGHVMRTNVTIQNNCARMHPPKQHMVADLCGTPSVSGRITKNDIGAPLVFQSNKFKRKKLIGFVTSVESVAKDRVQTLGFTKIHTYMDWISLITSMPFQLDKD